MISYVNRKTGPNTYKQVPSISHVGLPYAAHWVQGADWQLDILNAGRYIIPLGANHFPCNDGSNSNWDLALDEDIWGEIKTKGIPIHVRNMQYTDLFYGDLANGISGCSTYSGLPEVDNPNWINIVGDVIEDRVSPFGPVARWTELGTEWGSTTYIQALHTLYPDPPYVLLLSNNEPRTLKWWNAADSKRFVALYGGGVSEADTRLIFEEAWIERYTALFTAIKAQLPSWSDKIIFAGYETAMTSVGRYNGWTNATTTMARLNDTPYIWDGDSPDGYLNANQLTDYNGWSINIGVMKWPAIKAWYKKVNPNMYWGISTAAIPNFVTTMLGLGQTFPYERYGAIVKWEMWMTKPTVVRDFRWPISIEDIFDIEDEDMLWFEQVLDPVDEIHDSTILAEFWRDGELVLNTDREHPYQKNVAILPDDLSTPNQWYALTTSLEPSASDFPNNPTTGQSLAVVFNVWAMAQVLGEYPNRRWLVYTYAPLAAQNNVDIMIPEFGNITVDVTRAGSYFVVSETSGTYALLSS